MGGMRLVPHIEHLAREIVDVPFDFVKAAIVSSTLSKPRLKPRLTPFLHSMMELPKPL